MGNGKLERIQVLRVVGTERYYSEVCYRLFTYRRHFVNGLYFCRVHVSTFSTYVRLESVLTKLADNHNVPKEDRFGMLSGQSIKVR